MKAFTSLFASAVLACTAHAVTFNFTTIHSSSGTPSGPSPYAVLDVTQAGANTVNFSLFAGNLGAQEFISFFKYNIAGSATSPAITPSIVTGVGGSPVFSFLAAPAIDAGLSFDGEVTFETSGAGGGAARFTDGETFSFNLMRTGLLVSDINLPMMIHIQGIQPDGSAKVIAVLAPTGPGPGTGVPDSGATVALLGFAFAAIAFLKRKLG